MGFFNGKDQPENGFTVEDLQADAAKKVAILRAMAAEFINDNDNQPLTVSQTRLASRTPSIYLEKGAVVCEAAPEMPGTPPGAAHTLRLAYAADVVYASVIAEAEELVRQIRLATMRKKLFAISIARVVDKMARIFVQTGPGNWLKTHVDQMKRTLTRPPRPAKPEESVDDDTPATAKQ
jgi:hypothetical protein